jgi:hypothetical protein
MKNNQIRFMGEFITIDVFITPTEELIESDGIIYKSRTIRNLEIVNRSEFYGIYELNSINYGLLINIDLKYKVQESSNEIIFFLEIALLYLNTKTNKDSNFITYYFIIPVLIVAQFNKQRWHIELFFKWTKQRLCINSFLSTSVNTVKIQIWITIIVYIFMVIIKKCLNLDISLYTFLQILSVRVFEKISILQLVKDVNYINQTNPFLN